MRPVPARAFWLVAPVAMALGLLVAAPSRWLGIDIGALGAALLLLACWAGLWWADTIPDDAGSAASPGEQKRWIELAFTTAIGAVMLANADVFAHAVDVGELRVVGRPIGILVVGWIVLGALLRRRLGLRVQEDERDRVVEARAVAWSYAALAFSVLGLVVMFGFSPAGRLQWATPIVIANMLVFALVWSSFVGSVVALACYRHDRA